MIPALVGRLAVALTRWAHRHGQHIYLSTGCLHGGADHSDPGHVYCQTQARRYDGTTKISAVCKFCSEGAGDDDGHGHGGACVCRCHREGL
ncbi:hypothetical protein [Streptomyces violascens]|uniref:hypothetical protein n=1 Tax=Streptomyces violascens TaxID=67381 RepID=UPI0036917FBB